MTSGPPQPPGPTGDAGSGLAKDKLVYERYLPMVRRIAMKLVRRLPRHISIDDLIGAGWVGLVEALRRRDSIATEDQFEAYAAHRVRGAILDYLRSIDPMTRRMRGASRQITTAIKKLTSELGRAPLEEEIAAELGLDIDAYCSLLNEVAEADPTRIELTDLHSDGHGPAPDDVAVRRELADHIAEAIEQMPQRLQLVLALRYQEECSLREVGEVLGLTEARACQLHAEAIHRIRAHLETMRPPPMEPMGPAGKKPETTEGAKR
ncbi:MAG TPA: RNA polymerase sigma factor FliA [Polyangiaceae bacterium]|jgi:RNA polymerase sigma factor for flagellar operon FliA